MHHAVIVHEEKPGGALAVEGFRSKHEARAAFKKIKSGVATLYELRRSQAVKRANFDIRHDRATNSLDQMSDSRLRAEAKKRKLAIAGNPQARPADLINEIQQHELNRRLQHRQPFQAVATPQIPADQVPKEEK